MRPLRSGHPKTLNNKQQKPLFALPFFGLQDLTASVKLYGEGHNFTRLVPDLSGGSECALERGHTSLATPSAVSATPTTAPRRLE